MSLSDLESPTYTDTGLEQRFPSALSIHPRADPYGENRYRKRSRTLSSVSSEDCEDEYANSPHSFTSQGSNWQSDLDSGMIHNYTGFLHNFIIIFLCPVLQSLISGNLGLALQVLLRVNPGLSTNQALNNQALLFVFIWF